MPADLRETLQKKAKEADRSLNAEILRMLKKALQKH